MGLLIDDPLVVLPWFRMSPFVWRSPLIIIRAIWMFGAVLGNFHRIFRLLAISKMMVASTVEACPIGGKRIVIIIVCKIAAGSEEGRATWWLLKNLRPKA